MYSGLSQITENYDSQSNSLHVLHAVFLTCCFLSHLKVNANMDSSFSTSSCSGIHPK